MRADRLPLRSPLRPTPSNDVHAPGRPPTLSATACFHFARLLQVLMSPALARTAGPDGFAIITCSTPAHGSDYVPGKTWSSIVDILQNNAVLK